MRLPADRPRARSSFRSTRRLEETSSTEPRSASTAANSFSPSSHWAAMRMSSSSASTRAAPARKIAWLSARISRIMGIFISCRELTALNPLIGELRQRTANVYNSDKSGSGLHSRRRNLLIGHDIFLNPQELGHNRIIWVAHPNVVTKYKETVRQV